MMAGVDDYEVCAGVRQERLWEILCEGDRDGEVTGDCDYEYFLTFLDFLYRVPTRPGNSGKTSCF